MHGCQRNEHGLTFDFRHYSKEHLKFNVIFHSPILPADLAVNVCCPYPTEIGRCILMLDFKGLCVIIHAIILKDKCTKLKIPGEI